MPSGSVLGIYSQLNNGTLRNDDITTVKASVDRYLLPEAIKGNNVFRISNASGARVTVGGGNDSVYGAAGSDTAVLDFAKSAITSISATDDGLSIILKTTSEQKLLSSIENLSFTDQTLTTASLLQSPSTPSTPLFTAPNSTSGYIEPTRYTGAVSFLEWQLLGSDAGDVVIGAKTNDFISLGVGDDAVRGEAGRDVLDAGLGSGFLTGGADADVFFVDGRNPVATWSTITDFSKAQGDTVNMWGWREGVSQLITSLNDGGAAGYTGATFHYDLDGNRAIDTSITFAGLTTSQVGNPTVNSVAGNGYLLFA
jgi:serralysin